MAHDSHSPEELSAQIARNREELAAQRDELRYSMDVGARMQRSFHDNAPLFLGTAAILGVLFALIPSRRVKEQHYHVAPKPAPREEHKRKPESKSFMAVLLGLAGKAALDMGKPIVLKMLREHFLNAHQRPAAEDAPPQSS